MRDKLGNTLNKANFNLPLLLAQIIVTFIGFLIKQYSTFDIEWLWVVAPFWLPNILGITLILTIIVCEDILDFLKDK